MRLTRHLSDDRHRRAEARAVECGRTFHQLVDNALRLALDDSRAPWDLPARQFRPPRAGQGLQPGVDLGQQASLLDRMNEG